MTDRELLEAAAKAAGVPLEWPHDPATYARINDVSPRRTDTWDNWNPLTDDADAFRLAVALKMDLLRADDCIEAQCGELIQRDGKELYAFGIEPLGDDPAAATRRAIDRDAASMAGAAHD